MSNLYPPVSVSQSFRPGYRFSLVVTALGSLILSSGGLLARQMEGATGWQIIFYRSIGLFVGLWVLFGVRHREMAFSRVRETWKAALLAGPFQGAASIFFILALMQTTVANAMLPMSCVPLIAAGLGWLILGEPIRLVTVIALCFAGLGVAVMTAGGAAQGTTSGAALALANAFSFALYLVLVRRETRHGGGDMLPAVMVGSLLAGTTAAFVTPSFAISAHDLLICIVWGSLVQCTGVACVIFGARRLFAAELSLLTLVESASGPLLVWIILSERPGNWSILGGLIVLSVVALWLLEQIVRERNARARASTAITPTL